jgi:protein-disulfide isomerase
MSTLKVAVNSADHRQGNPNASIVLIEYGDFECPHCKLAHPLVQRLLRERGYEILFVYRNFPLRKIHPNAYISAVAAEAAGKQNKFWEMHHLIFENQSKLNANYLVSLAEIIDLDFNQFTRDFRSEEIQHKIQSDFEGGLRSGVNGTPTFFINDFPVLTYDETYESLAKAVQMQFELIPNEAL